MYLSEKPRPIDFYKEEGSRDMMIEVVSNGGGGETADLDLSHHHHHPHHHSQMVLGESSGGEEQEVRAAAAAASAPKKRAETWVQDETRCLIALRRETDGLFNTSKSNKHLWDQISAKMRDRGFDRSPTMCTDKWRNLLKEFKKAKHHRDRGSGSASAKMLYYKEIEEILRERGKNSQYKSPTTPPPPPPQTAAAAAAAKVDSFMQFSDKGIDDASISFGQVEACGRQVLNPERRLDHDGHPLAITAAEAVAASGVPPWNWRDTPGNGGDGQSYGGTGKVISVKWGDYTRRIGIDGTAEAIKEAIKSAFRLRTRRAFWLEDEDQVIRSLDKNMPLGNYTLHLDEGLVIKVCLYDGSDHMPMHTEEKIFFTEDDYRDFLTRRGWTCLREFDGYNVYYNMDDLRPGAIYRGVS